VRFFCSRFTARRNGSITERSFRSVFQTCFSGTVFDHLVEIPVVAGSFLPRTYARHPSAGTWKSKKKRANLKSLRCNSLFEVRRRSFFGVPGTNVESFLRGVSPPGLLLLNWQGSY
jgi:hypothetical protein